MKLKKEILIVFTVTFLVSISPVMIRWYAYGIPGIIGFPTYYHQRITDYIISGTFSWYDPLSFGGRPYTYPPLFSFMLAGFSILGLELGGVIMMGLLGGLTGVIAFLIAREVIGKKNAFIAILLSSPAFIFLFSHLSTRSPPITLGLLSIYLVMKKRPWWLISLPLAFSYFFHIETGLIFSALVMFVNRDYLDHAKSIIVAVLLAGVFYAPLFLAYGLPVPNAIHEDYIARGYGLESLNLPYFSWETSFLENGPTYDNVALLVLVISFAGFYFTKNRFLRIWFALSVILALASTRLLMYLVFPAAILATVAIYHFSKKSKKYGKFLLLGFLAYSVIIGSWMAVSFGTSWPTKSETEALLWIRQNTPENVTVLSDWTWGHWITGIAYRRSFVDGYAEYAPQADLRMSELEQFYRNCTIPQGYGIQYAYLEDWFIRQQNITCLDRFQKVYEKDQIYVFRLE
jgi:asparagine N-glycosylation enzyme membrane subunit Stt3